MIKPTLLDIKRIHALTDATFGVAMTILILNVEVPAGLTIDHMHDVLKDKVFFSLIVYMISFVILGSFWNESHYHNHLIVKSDLISSWMYILYLMFVCMIPFSSHFVVYYPREKISIIFYLLNLLCVNAINIITILYTWRKQYIEPQISRVECKSIVNRILIPSLLYAIFIPLCYVISNWILYLFPIPLIAQMFFTGTHKSLFKNGSF